MEYLKIDWEAIAALGTCAGALASFLTVLFAVLSNKKTYKELYPIFETAFNSNLPPHKWYNENICNSF